MERRLTTILAIDVVGYSRLMRKDEEGTLAKLIDLRQLIDKFTAEHSGRTFGAAGDSVLAEFSSPVEAVRCSINIQHQTTKTNTDVPEDAQMKLRIGVNLGDVMDEKGSLYGDGINVAARLESLSEPGGLCISGTIYDYVRDRVDLMFRDAGEQVVKNIDRPVHVWKWSPSGSYLAREAELEPLPLPEKPSIAVLAFENMSGDPDQEYFADGLSEDLITTLSYVPWIFVIARNSSFIYKGRSVDARKIGAELGVRYLLEGSIRQAGGRVRVTGQLIDTDTGNHIWADRFDGVLEDIFELQDTITRAVVDAIAPKIEIAEIERASNKRPDSLTAYDHYLRARAELNNLQIGEATRLLEQAIAVSSDYAKAKAVRAWCYTLHGWRDGIDTEGDRITAIQLADEALASPNADSETSAYAGYTIAFMHSGVERGIQLVEEATEQCPSFAWAWASLALLELYYRKPERAIELGKIALRLSPRDPQNFRSEMAIAGAYFNLDRFEECLKYAEQGLQKAPESQSLIMFRIVCLVQLDQFEQARAAAHRFIERQPKFSISRWSALTRCSPDSRKTATMEDTLRKAGLPD